MKHILQSLFLFQLERYQFYFPRKKLFKLKREKMAKIVRSCKKKVALQTDGFLASFFFFSSAKLH